MATRIDGGFRGGIRRLTWLRAGRGDDYSWFDHPEMQARIARAEADFREGRGFMAHSVDELLAHLHALKKPER
ncbi:MAG TPA: hypothetical protein VHG91_21065 [Longimicrobium sp.]|nr:hypothetical protein [Longimicrobium sp.]